MSTTVPNNLLKKPLCMKGREETTILKAPPMSRPARPRMPVDSGQVLLEVRNNTNKLKWVEEARGKFEKNRNPYGQYGTPYKIGDQFRDKYDPIADVGYGLSRVPVKFRRVRAPGIPQLSDGQAKACLKDQINNAIATKGNWTLDVNRSVNHNVVRGNAINNRTAPIVVNTRPLHISEKEVAHKQTIGVSSGANVPYVNNGLPKTGKPSLRAKIMTTANAGIRPPTSVQPNVGNTDRAAHRYIGEHVSTPIDPKYTVPYTPQNSSRDINENTYINFNSPISATTPLTLPYGGDVYEEVNTDRYVDYKPIISASATATADLPHYVNADRPVLEKAYDIGSYDIPSDPREKAQYFTPHLRDRGKAAIGRGNFANHNNSYEVNENYYDDTPIEGYADTSPLYENEYQEEYTDNIPYHQKIKLSAGLHGIGRAQQKNKDLRNRINYMKGDEYTDTADPILKRAWEEW